MRLHEQAETMIDAWVDGQKKLWGSWYEAARAAVGPAPLAADVLDRWRELSVEGLEAWAAGTRPVLEEAVEGVFAGRDLIARMFDLFMNGWRATAQKLGPGGSWPDFVADLADQLRRQTISLFREPLVTARDLLDWDAYEPSIGRLLETPRVGYTRELSEKVLKTYHSWLDFRFAAFEYQLILAEAWARTFGQFVRNLTSLAEKGESIRSLKELFLSWSDTCDRVLIEVFSSEGYARVQGRLLNAALAYRLREREAMDVFLTSSHLPTRSEVEGAARSVYELRKELRAVRKALREGEGGTASPQAAGPAEGGAPSARGRGSRSKPSQEAPVEGPH